MFHNHSLEVEKAFSNQQNMSEWLLSLRISCISIISFFILSHYSGCFVSIFSYFSWLKNVFQGSFGQYHYILSLYLLCIFILKTSDHLTAGLFRSTHISDLFVTYSSKYCYRSCSGQSLPLHHSQGRLSLLSSVNQLNREVIVGKQKTEMYSLGHIGKTNKVH